MGESSIGLCLVEGTHNPRGVISSIINIYRCLAECEDAVVVVVVCCHD